MSNKVVNLIKAVGVLFLIGILSFSFFRSNSEIEASREGILMDTFVSIKLWGKDRNVALEESWKTLEYLSKVFDRFNSESEVYKINENAGRFVDVSEDTLNIIKTARKYAELSNGYFDPTVSPLLEIWGFYNRNYRVPSEIEIEKALNFVNFRKIEVEDNKVKLTKNGMGIDLGGVAKGYMAEKLLNIAKKYSLTRGIFDIGGTIAVFGKPLEGESWGINIRHPREDGFLGKVLIKEGVVATSGDYERFFIKDGKRYCHIFNPKTGYPEGDLMSVSVISQSGTEADILSTTFFAAGKEAVTLWREKFSNVGLILMYSDGKLWISDNVIFRVEK
ncbi:MAG TPA: FAD:protein FMN transferase [Dictyoglomaceae bacterium]|nr:FAD:protein FMN transferase [Dictyoglomaceae bacterium]HOL38722.1 FAD:protein FMN transferase [Dictyoglomaceae bacterium]HOP94574.1 FAD:protein FMN transferase [Dictyoglomaceae bacterium]HPP15529.1 FAD:protein FMN transferase [Dictyoglomaceae bacterium]HPU42844.1 FAD:protein FMN transferase [Dictyoglomaceae bacterium]